MKFNDLVSEYLEENLSGLPLQEYISKLETVVNMLKNKTSTVNELGMDKIGTYIIEIGTGVKNLK